MKSNVLRLLLFVTVVLILSTFTSALVMAGPPDNRPPGGDGGDVDIGDIISTNDVVNTTTVTTNTNVAGTTMNAGDVAVNHSSKAFAFAHGLGDVDINQCIVSKQTGTFIISWQGYDYNLWCMGEVFDAKGLYHMGAEMRCDIKPIATKFATREECLTANIVQLSPDADAITQLITRVLKEKEELEEEHETEMQTQQERIDRLESKLGSLENQARVVYQRAITDKQRQALREVLAE